MGIASFQLSASRIRRKVIVRPETVRRAKVHTILEYEKNAESLIDVAETKATLLHIRTLPDWHLSVRKMAKLSSRAESTAFNATAALMTENWRKRWKRNENKLWMVAKLNSNNENTRLKFSADGLASTRSIDECIKRIHFLKSRWVCLTVSNCEHVLQNKSDEWVKHYRYWQYI